ncbi:MAG: quinol dehydrogenase ferredoxin subunit NapH [Nitrospirota bacterium]|nr:quinol dehydrogenase ferredoxin subunit NapH [Nitrospirota bacterium]
MGMIRKHRYLISRRTSQISIMLLFIAGNVLGWKVLAGNLSTSKVLGAVHLADPFAVIQIFATGNSVSSEALVGALIIILFFGVFAGRAFCSWVCPVNILTDMAGWLRKKIPGESGERTLLMSRNVRYWVIGISLVLSLFTGVAAFEWISPISMLHRGIIFGMGMGWTAVLAVFLFDLLMVRNGFCGHVCPLGGFYSLIGRFSLLRVRHDREKCTLCMRCIETCPERQVLPMVGKQTALVSSGECSNCARCIEVCDDKAMEFVGKFFSAKKQDEKEGILS